MAVMSVCLCVSSYKDISQNGQSPYDLNINLIRPAKTLSPNQVMFTMNGGWASTHVFGRWGDSVKPLAYAVVSMETPFWESMSSSYVL